MSDFSNELMKQRYEFCLFKLNELNNFLIDKGFKTKFNYFESYESYFKISNLNGLDISLIGLDKSILNNSICLSPMLVKRVDNKDYIFRLWFYTGGDDGHHSFNINLTFDFISSDIFFDFVLDYIDDFFISPFKVCKYQQLSLF